MVIKHCMEVQYIYEYLIYFPYISMISEIYIYSFCQMPLSSVIWVSIKYIRLCYLSGSKNTIKAKPLWVELVRQEHYTSHAFIGIFIWFDMTKNVHSNSYHSFNNHMKILAHLKSWVLRQQCKWTIPNHT